MKRIALAVLMVLVASPVFADTMLTFKDGAAPEVWTSFEKKGNQYCTVKEYLGDYCVNMADVKSVKKVADGTKATEYEMNIGGSSGGDLEAVLSKSEAEDRAFKARRDAEIGGRVRAEQKRVDKNRRDGKADWAR